ncbi:hypothetical protein D3C74_394530 [compost metagenome]
MKRHFDPFVSVFVMHEMNDVQRIYIQFSQPFHHWNETFHDFVIFEIFGSDRWIFRTYLRSVSFVFTAVDRVQ